MRGSYRASFASFLESGEYLPQEMFVELFQIVLFRLEVSTFTLERLMSCSYGSDESLALQFPFEHFALHLCDQ